MVHMPQSPGGAMPAEQPPNGGDRAVAQGDRREPWVGCPAPSGSPRRGAIQAPTNRPFQGLRHDRGPLSQGSLRSPWATTGLPTSWAAGRAPFLELTVALLAAVATLVPARRTEAAVGCTLSNPARDLKFLYPTMTTYREEARQFDTMPGGKEMFEALKERIGSDLDPVYETYDTPYTLYTVYKGEEVIGIVHGVNVPGKGGVIQVFLSMDPKSAGVRQLVFQRLESPAARALKAAEFRKQFEGLTLADFYKHDYFAVADPTSDKDRVGRITNPVKEGEGSEDFAASLRGVRKNLILLDLFFYARRHEPFYQRAREALAKLKAGKK